MSGRRLVLGIGLSSRATAEEVRRLARTVVEAAGTDLGSLAAVATRPRFLTDARLRLGPPVVGVDDEVLRDRYPAPGARFPAKVAEGCALRGAGEAAELLVPTTRSAHATAALAGLPVPSSGSDDSPRAPLARPGRTANPLRRVGR